MGFSKARTAKTSIRVHAQSSIAQFTFLLELEQISPLYTTYCIYQGKGHHITCPQHFFSAQKAVIWSKLLSTVKLSPNRITRLYHLHTTFSQIWGHRPLQLPSQLYTIYTALTRREKHFVKNWVYTQIQRQSRIPHVYVLIRTYFTSKVATTHKHMLSINWSCAWCLCNPYESGISSRVLSLIPTLACQAHGSKVRSRAA